MKSKQHTVFSSGELDRAIKKLEQDNSVASYDVEIHDQTATGMGALTAMFGYKPFATIIIIKK